MQKCSTTEWALQKNGRNNGHLGRCGTACVSAEENKMKIVAIVWNNDRYMHDQQFVCVCTRTTEALMALDVGLPRTKINKECEEEMRKVRQSEKQGGTTEYAVIICIGRCGSRGWQIDINFYLHIICVSHSYCVVS